MITCEKCKGDGLIGSGDQPWLKIGQKRVCDACTGTGKVGVEEQSEAAPEAEEEKGEVYDGPLAKYKVIGEIFPLKQDGTKQPVALEIGSIHELPEVAGDLMVSEGTMEKVSETTESTDGGEKKDDEVANTEATGESTAPVETTPVDNTENAPQE